MKLKNIKTIAVTLTLTLLAPLTSRIFIYVPETKGLLNMGEPIFLTSALLLGPFIGAFVGGIGYAIADLILGYPQYAIAALTVKAAAGFAIGKIVKNKPSNNIFRLASIVLLSLLLGLTGANLYSGRVYVGYVKTLYLGENVLEYGGLKTFYLHIPPWFWIIASAATFFYTAFMEFKKKRNYGHISLSLLSGTLIIVSGYLLYETFPLRYFFKVEVNATANIPINIGQTTVSSILAILLAEVTCFGKYLRRHFKKATDNKL